MKETNSLPSFLAAIKAANDSSDSGVTFEYIPQTQTISQGKNFVFFEKYAAMSRTGATNLSTTGFEGCLGVLVSPVNPNRGGILVHISQLGGSGEGKKIPYLIEHIGKILDFAPTAWTEFDVTLFKGDVTGEGTAGNREIEIPDLPNEIRENCGKAASRIRQVHDLRRFRTLMESVLYQSASNTFYLRESADLDTDFTENLQKQIDDAAKKTPVDPETRERRRARFEKAVKEGQLKESDVERLIRKMVGETDQRKDLEFETSALSIVLYMLE